jgi:hypothetical protein
MEDQKVQEKKAPIKLTPEQASAMKEIIEIQEIIANNGEKLIPLVRQFYGEKLPKHLEDVPFGALILMRTPGMTPNDELRSDENNPGHLTVVGAGCDFQVSDLVAHVMHRDRQIHNIIADGHKQYHVEGQGNRIDALLSILLKMSREDRI